jgi:Rhodopirellula transposase DDE domain
MIVVKTDTSISEQQMKLYYESLSEKDRRRYAAIEAQKIGYGGIQYISQLFKCNYRTIRQGFADLKQFDLISNPRIRNPGGGRKKVIETVPGINEIFLKVIENHTAGSPMDEEIKWTNLTRQEIANLLAEKEINISVTVVDQLLALHSFRRRKAVKAKACGISENRNEQFENIENIKNKYVKKGNPILSMDSKKKS